MRRFTVIAVSLVVLAGDPEPEPEPTAPELPGFDSCVIEQRPDVGLTVCPEDDDFPWGEALPGRIVGTPAVFGDPSEVALHVEGSDAVWLLQATAHYSLAFEAADWTADTLEEAPLIELTVAAACSDREGHWFAVRDLVTSRLLAAGGTSAVATPAGWAVDADTASTSRCALDDARSCSCWGTCSAKAVRFTSPSGTELALYPSERSLLDGMFHALVFDASVAAGEPSGEVGCEDAPAEVQRWAITLDAIEGG